MAAAERARNDARYECFAGGRPEQSASGLVLEQRGVRSRKAWPMRIVAWNIRAGGGKRAAAIAAQIRQWNPDVVALSEFRATAPSARIAEAICDTGLRFQRTSVDHHRPSTNALLVAARWPVRLVRLRRAPRESTRWLHVNVSAPRPFALLALHIPNRLSGRKYPFLDAVTQVASSWRGRAALIIGDTNSGRIGVDEESPAFNKAEDRWMVQMEALGWPDAFRWLHRERREFTWYSPNGNNGFRLDQAFVHRSFLTGVVAVSHAWGGDTSVRREALSDHAALIVDFDNYE